MVKKSKRPKLKQSQSHKKRKKKLQHFGFIAGAAGAFRHQAIQDAWDPKKTLRQNYRALGLVADVNSDVRDTAPSSSSVSSSSSASSSAAASTAADALDQELKEAKEFVPAPKIPRMSLDEQRVYRTLINKHGSNYEAMARDIDINTFQRTPRQLEKRIAIYQQLQAL